MIIHFKSKRERLDFVRGKFTEIVPEKAEAPKKAAARAKDNEAKMPEAKDKSDFEKMNKTQLIEYALANGIKVKVKDTKENILKAVKGAK